MDFKVFSSAAALALCSLFALPLSGEAQEFTWNVVPMDGIRTGVVPANADNVAEAIGRMEGKTYHSPSGRVFRNDCVSRVAADLIEAQKDMYHLKQAIGRSAKTMKVQAPECALSDLFVDVVMTATEDLTGKSVDLGILNFGGIRVDMPQGDILLDDIISMFPFRNYLCYVALKGSRVREILEDMAATRIQVLGGVRIVVKDKKLVEAVIGGEPIDDEKVYGLATISFLLNGGDKLHLAKDAIDLVQTEVTPKEVLVDYVKALTAKGEILAYEADGRVNILDGQANRAAGDNGENDSAPKKALSGSETVPVSEAEYVPSLCKGQRKFSIIHFNDTHSHFEPVRDGDGKGLGGVVEIAAFVDSVRHADGNRNLLLLHAGDFGQGTSYFTTFAGDMEIELLNDMKYDAVTLGNHEFDNGISDLARRLSKLKCPVVCANYDFSGLEIGKYIRPYTIVRKGGLKIGIFGMLTDVSSVVDSRIAASMKKYDDVRTADYWASYLKNEKHCDMVIALTHLGFELENKNNMTDPVLAASTENIDVIVGGHSHTFPDRLYYFGNKSGDGVPVVQNGCWGLDAAQLVVRY